MEKVSICIPIYQQVVKRLVTDLYDQCVSANVSFEICLIDDASSTEIQLQNRPLSSIASYEELPSNIGRSRIRNLFLQKITGSQLLFLDCDVQVPPSFIKTYIPYVSQASQIVHGGFKYKVDKGNRKGRELRYAYGKRIEEKTENIFFSRNFLVSKDIFESISFDESITTYGYEDVLFAQQYQYLFGDILFINNPVIVNEIDTNEDFIRKTNEAMQTLAMLYQNKKIPDTSIRLLLVYEQLKQNKLVEAFYELAKPMIPMLLFSLHSKHPSLKFFQMYKLIRFIEQMSLQYEDNHVN